VGRGAGGGGVDKSFSGKVIKKGGKSWRGPFPLAKSDEKLAKKK